MKYPKKFIALLFIFVPIILFALMKGFHMAIGEDVTYMNKFNKTANEDQKKVLTYLQGINVIFEEARETQAEREGSPWGEKNISGAVDAINQLLAKAKAISPPEICQKYYDLTLEILNIIRTYQSNRLKFGDGPEFEENTRDAHLKQFQLEEERQKEYFSILKRIGYNEFAEKEIVKDGLVGKDELDLMKKSDK